MLWHGKNFRGIINKAKQMIFDNTGTDLISTNAEDAIKEVNSNLAIQTVPVSYASGVTLDGGGVYRMGELVIVQMRLNLSSSITNNIVTSLPTPKGVSGSGGHVIVTNNKQANISIDGFGNIYTSASITAGILLVSCAYFAN